MGVHAGTQKVLEIDVSIRKPIIESCKGCEKVVDVEGTLYCLVYADPAFRWSFGTCPVATHVERKLGEPHKKVNPLKASKRAARGG